MAQRRRAEPTDARVAAQRDAADAARAGAGARTHRLTPARPAVVFRVPTSRGEAQVSLDRVSPPLRVGLLVLGHGAGGDIDAPDLVAVRDAAVRAGWVAARVTQPYRVAGRRAPAPAAQLDDAFVVAVTAVRRRLGSRGGAVPLVVGGRSSGARVAARTAGALDAAGVLALAFPLHPPGRPETTRAAELDPGRPTLVINGDGDPFGVPAAAGAVQVVVRAGERHELRRDPAGVAQVVVDWLAGISRQPDSHVSDRASRR